MKLKNLSFFMGLIITIIGCKRNEMMRFSENKINTGSESVVELNIDQVNGTSEVSALINDLIESHVIPLLLLDDTQNESISMIQAADRFNESFRSFIQDFPESNQLWSAQIDGEVSYQSKELISYTLISYIDSGGAHGNQRVEIINIDPMTGSEIDNTELFHDQLAIHRLAESYLIEELKNSNYETNMTKQFVLPENIGYNQKGVLFLYNAYEIGPYSLGMIEFTIPFNEISKQLVYH